LITQSRLYISRHKRDRNFIFIHVKIPVNSLGLVTQLLGSTVSITVTLMNILFSFYDPNSSTSLQEFPNFIDQK
jgi:hypothetical protein